MWVSMGTDYETRNEITSSKKASKQGMTKERIKERKIDKFRTGREQEDT